LKLNHLHYVSTRLRRLLAQLRYLPRAFALVWTAARKWTVAWVVLLAAQGLIPVAVVYLSRAIVNRFVAAMRTHGATPELQAAGIVLAALALILLLSEFLQSTGNRLRTAQAALLQDHISRLIHQKSAAVDLAFYDSPDFYDHLHRARSEAAERAVALLENLGGLFQNGITLFAMLGVLLPFGAWVPLVLAASSVPALLVVLRFAALQHDFQTRTTADERRSWYYDWVLTDRETAAEIRLFGLGAHFQAAFQAVRDRLRGEKLDMARRQSMAEFAAGAATLVMSSGSVCWMLWRAIRGAASLGDVALFYQAMQQGLLLTRTLLENAGHMYKNSLFLGHLFEFLELESQVREPGTPAPLSVPISDGIVFRGVNFRYPGTNRLTLRKLDLRIEAGRVTAVIGANGAGKSTLIKLLCRFYDAQEGAVEIDGKDVRTFSTEELRATIAVLFQQPVHYNETVAQNISFGDLSARADREAIIEAAQGAGAAEMIEKLAAGYDTLLGRWFENGSELSTGQWQRIALARAFLRKAPLVILDEPTSAMDPWAEADWLRRFRRLAAGRTTVMITHRFTTALTADTICVMVDGQVVEQGTHEELLAARGRYAQGWEAQRQ
jgi:ATP-binding cassette subfamily B protein